jgi:GNAT superfamily N-acetyltransferase
MDRGRYHVRRAVTEDVPLLPDIERVAASLFKTYPSDLGLTEENYESVGSVETFAEAEQRGRLWVAATGSGAIVGFARVTELSGYAHLDELDVRPSHGRQGIGSALLATVCSWAQERGYLAVTLRTFRDVPWNGPFYRGRGFHIVEGARLSERHLELEAAAKSRGLRTDLRITMAYNTAD